MMYTEIELFDHLTVCKETIELFMMHDNIWNHLTVCKRMSHVEKNNSC